MLGQFAAGELEKFLTVTIGVYIAGRLVKDPQNRGMVGLAAITGTAAQLLMGTIVDIAKVQFAVEDFEAVEGLPESVFATEGLLSATICSSPAFSSACSPRCIWFPSCTARLSLCWAWRPVPGRAWLPA